MTIKNKTNKRLIYWRDRPLDVEIGLFRELSNVYSEIVIITSTNYENNRKDNNWGYNFPKNINTIYINNISDIDHRKFINDDNLFHGITGINNLHLKMFLSINKNFKFSICAERPNIYGNRLKKLWMKLTRWGYYRFYFKKYRSNILCFFAMGDIGVKSYLKYGVEEKKLFPIMYTLDLHNCYSASQDLCKKNVVSIVYFGRFDDETKGLDILRDAWSSLDYSENYQLYLAGGYGKDSKKTINWIENTKNAHYLGAWKQNEIFEKLGSYDVCIAPSRYDGWNLTPNHAIDAGNAVIISNNAGSDDLVRYANCGIVYESSSLIHLKESILYTVNHLDKIKEWKKNSINYKQFINNEKIARYFISALEFCKSGYNTIKPIAPWIK